MKHQNHQHLDLPAILFSLDGVEVTELHGSFAEAQWYQALERQHKDPKRERLIHQWTNTVAFMIGEHEGQKHDPQQSRDAGGLRTRPQWTTTTTWKLPDDQGKGG